MLKLKNNKNPFFIPFIAIILLYKSNKTHFENKIFKIRIDSKIYDLYLRTRIC